MRVALIFWLVLLVALCLAPVEFKHHLRTNGRYHNVGHILAFFITSILALWQARSGRWRGLLVLLCFGLAYATEYTEHFVYHNRFEWRDVSRDSVGVLFGFLFTELRWQAVDLEAAQRLAGPEI
jgi:predicted membrane channel-forming protein YqfA (hemolysin III family)